MNKEIYELLYHYRENGYEGYDLEEVQLLEKIDVERVEGLKLLLCNDDRYIVYQSMLILLAWAIPEGFEFLNRFMSEKWEEKGEFEPHRLHGEDNVYDVIANALYIATFNGKDIEELYPYIKQFLDLYGDRFFESHLKNFLLKENCKPLLKEIEEGLQNALKNKRTYQASQLFPVLVHYDKAKFNDYRDAFILLTNQDKRIAYNVEEAENIKIKRNQ